MKPMTPGIGVLVALFLISCSQSNIPSGPQSSGTKAVPYFNNVKLLDDPDYAMQHPTGGITTNKSLSNLTPRFSNSDRSRLLSTEVNYFDGNIQSLGVYQYTGDQLTRLTWYGDAGIDGIWQTADDVVTSYHDHSPTNPDVLYTIYRNSGLDQTWFTEDDDILYYYKPVLNAAGNTIGIGTYTLAGEDNIWFNDDDFIGWLTTEDTANNETRWVMYLGAGADNNWLTLGDNQIYRFALTTLNADGQRQRHSFFQDPGIDGLAFTDDDDLNYYHDYSYDTLARPNENIMYVGPGTDALWYTADDIVRSCKTLTRDANDLPTQTVSYRPGPDQTCFTTDDIIWGYHDDRFNAADLLTDSNSYYRPGADNTWFTTDDVLIYARTYR